MKLLLMLLLQLIPLTWLGAQDAPASFSLSGQASALFGKESAILTFGGPGISFTANKLELSVRFLPSLRYDTDKKLAKPNESFRPVLGVGLQARFKKLLLTTPALYFLQNRWEFAVGIGLSLGTGKK